ncbi:hypothetical protein JTB14_025578 [Gonioctena quinquepunctata]|nr:hypothetical protein JTB14_025578 [Gonioctena quinquepunctata]
MKATTAGKDPNVDISTLYSLFVDKCQQGRIKPEKNNDICDVSDELNCEIKRNMKNSLNLTTKTRPPERMCLKYFLDFLYLRSKYGPIVAREKYTASHIKSYNRKSFTDENFKTVEFERIEDRTVVMPAVIPELRKTKKKISNEKYRDLMIS